MNEQPGQGDLESNESHQYEGRQAEHDGQQKEPSLVSSPIETSSAKSSLMQSPSLRSDATTDTPLTSPTGHDDGFLGIVAKWGAEEGWSTKASNQGVRTSRMIGTRIGVSPPPPPGPPPSNPPPLPPLLGSSIPEFTNSQLPAGKPNTRSSIFSPTRSPPGPPLPPPSSGLPLVPAGAALPAAIQMQAGPSNASNRRSISPPGVRVSPRSSSLISAAHITNSASPNGHAESSKSHRSGRTPSRHLLQNALDLAQRAVEMDRNNDVAGALAAYREAVDKLKSVMERVGVEPSRDDKKKKGGRTEEEGRTLRGIHDAYLARIDLLTSFERSQNGNIADNLPTSPTTRPSASTATLVPLRSGQSPLSGATSGENTPRPSLDDTAVGIGNLMLNDTGDTTISSIGSPLGHPRTGLGSPFGSSRMTARTSSLHNLDQSSYRGSHSNSSSIDSHGSPISRQRHLTDDSDLQTHQNIGSAIGIPPRAASRTSHNVISPPYFTSPTDTGAEAASSNISLTSSSPTAKSNTSSRKSHRHTPSASLGIENELDLPISEGEEDGMEVLARTPQPNSALRSLPSGDSGALAVQQTSVRRGSEPYSNDKSLPPLPNSAPVNASQASPHTDAGRSVLMSPTTQGTIYHRRRSKGADSMGFSDTIDGLPSSSIPFPSNASNMMRNSIPSSDGLPPRIRAASQPSSRSSHIGTDDHVPPLPTASIRHKASFGSSAQSRITSGLQGLRIETGNNLNLSPAHLISAAGTVSYGGSRNGSLLSPYPENQPSEFIHRPFHLLRVLCSSIDQGGPGAYLTTNLNVPSTLWKAAGLPQAAGQNGGTSRAMDPVKIAGLDVKLRMMESLTLHAHVLRDSGDRLLDGEQQYVYDARQAIVQRNSLYVAVADEFCKSLDALEDEMDQSYKLLTKSGIEVGQWKGKGRKSGIGWSSKFNKTMDKISSSKTFETSDKYPEVLSNFAYGIQVIDRHLSNFSGQCTAGYASLPEPIYQDIQQRLARAAEFMGTVILPFVLEDAKLFCFRYLRTGLRYLED